MTKEKKSRQGHCVYAQKLMGKAEDITVEPQLFRPDNRKYQYQLRAKLIKLRK